MLTSHYWFSINHRQDSFPTSAGLFLGPASLIRVFFVWKVLVTTHTHTHDVDVGVWCIIGGFGEVCSVYILQEESAGVRMFMHHVWLARYLVTLVCGGMQTQTRINKEWGGTCLECLPEEPTWVLLVQWGPEINADRRIARFKVRTWWKRSDLKTERTNYRKKRTICCIILPTAEFFGTV